MSDSCKDDGMKSTMGVQQLLKLALHLHWHLLLSLLDVSIREALNRIVHKTQLVTWLQ